MTNPASAEDLRTHLNAALGGKGPPDARGASALRLRCRLQPAGGPGTKVMPPTYAGGDGPVYVEEERVIDGEEVPCASLDSVASQANRMEDLLALTVAEGEIPLPTIEVDQNEFGINSALTFSHRCFDAWVEDAELDGRPFGGSELWTELATARRHRATALLERFPVGLILGCWASRTRNPQGATRIPRALTSEIVGVGVVRGARASSKLDFRNVASTIPVYEAADGGRFTVDEERAVKEKNKPKPFRKGHPSEAGYGNVTPSVQDSHGGITMRYALHIATLSLPALRECRFPSQDGGQTAARNVAGRLMLGALALRMLALQIENGYDLRSGCLLVPEEEPQVELVGRLGQTVAAWPIVDAPTRELLEAAIDTGREEGLDWSGQSLSLVASADQLELLRRSLQQPVDEGSAAES